MFVKMMTFINELPVPELLVLFENQHPKELRWGLELKTRNYNNENSYYIYLKENEVIVAEVILGWLSKEVCNVDSFTVLPDHQGKGFGKAILVESIKWVKGQGFHTVRAMSKIPVSSSVFLKMGFIEDYIDHFWAGTEIPYMSVYLNLNKI